MKYILLAFCCFIFCSYKPVQQLPKYGVERCWFFSKQEFAGTIRVDENGNKKSKGSWFNNFIYLETKGNNIPVWQNFVYKNEKYAIITTPIKDSIVFVGKDKNNSKDIIIKPAKGNKIWLLQLQEFQANIPLKAIQVVLEGKLRKQKVQFSCTKKTIQIEPEIRP